MEAKERVLKYYETDAGKCPYQDWFGKIKDNRLQFTIDARLTRIRQGNFGHCRSVGNGVMELKIDYGPGYRVYFAEENKSIVILLCGGDKSTQSKDIKRAQKFWDDYKR